MNAFKCYREAFLLGGTHPDNSIYFLQHFMNNNLQNLNYQKVSASATIITVFILFSKWSYLYDILFSKEEDCRCISTNSTPGSFVFSIIAFIFFFQLSI